VLFNTEITSLTRLLRVYNGLLLSLVWLVQILGVKWLFVQPIRSLTVLLIFTAGYFLLEVLPLGTRYWAAFRRKLTVDIAVIYLLYLGVLLFLPQAFIGRNFFDGNGIVSTFIDFFGLVILYMPEESPGYFHFLPTPHQSRFIKLRYRRIIAMIFIGLSVAWLLNCGITNGLDFQVDQYNGF